MSLSRFFSVAFMGLDATLVDVEVDIYLPPKEAFSFVIVGLPDNAVKESKDRVLAAIKNSGFARQNMQCTVNLAPGSLKKEGVLYDLPIALAVLNGLGYLEKSHVNDIQSQYLIVGELSLSGEMRPIQGALAIAMLARSLGKKGVLLPASNAKEAAAVPNIDIIPIHNLNEAIQFMKSPTSISPSSITLSADLFTSAPISIDFADIRGHAHIKRAMEIVAAGGHNAVLSGPPGSGKTMLAKALTSIMPELTVDEALETTKIHSIAGILEANQNIVSQRPFRAPHHTISYAGMIGGGIVPRPGEVSLAHNGILFLDELPEFARMVLEVLRQPLEDRKVTISRANGNFTFPTSFVCIAAMNPCPCGNMGHPLKPCKDTFFQVERYRSKISGPLWDRMDMHLEVPALRYQDIMQGEKGESSITIRERVKKARLRQYARYGSSKTNSLLTSKETRALCHLDSSTEEIMRHAIEEMGISTRTCDRLLKVALTIADLDSSSRVKKEHLLEAISYRQKQIEAPYQMPPSNYMISNQY